MDHPTAEHFVTQAVDAIGVIDGPVVDETDPHDNEHGVLAAHVLTDAGHAWLSLEFDVKDE